ncbi:WD40-repeat-containing domain protein [Gymnopilus junonius]|uniref:WD40-repeat-containing domain protein n=1 Tax=Gymnopilus junonius TaxID=109634 RepID=A0A9P5NRL6_GYMJU|nr:WD40-repeat-containing domain protein [Gymnopilus junonius]
MRDIRTYNHPINCVFTKGRMAATGSNDCTVRIWDIHTGDCTWVFMGHDDTVETVALDNSWAYSGSRDHRARIWYLNTGDCTHILDLDKSFVLNIGLSASYWSASLSCNIVYYGFGIRSRGS